MTVAFLGKRPQRQKFIKGNIGSRERDSRAQREIEIKRAAQEPARIGFKRIIEPDKRAGFARRSFVGHVRAQQRAVAEIFAPQQPVDQEPDPRRFRPLARAYASPASDSCSASRNPSISMITAALWITGTSPA